MSQSWKQKLEAQKEKFEEQAQDAAVDFMQRFLGTVAGITRRKMKTGETVDIRTGFLAESFKSKYTPKEFKVNVPFSSPRGWTPADYHIENIARTQGGGVEGEIGSEVWYANVLAKGAKAGPNKSATIQGTPIMKPAVEEAKRRMLAENRLGEQLQ